MQYKASPFQCNKESLSQDATRKSNTSSKSTQKAGLIQVANWKAEKGPNYMFEQDRKFSVAVAIITFWMEAAPFGYFPMTNIIQSCSVKATSYQSVLLSSLPLRKGRPQNKPILSRFFSKILFSRNAVLVPLCVWWQLSFCCGKKKVVVTSGAGFEVKRIVRKIHLTDYTTCTHHTPYYISNSCNLEWAREEPEIRKIIKTQFPRWWA